MKFFKILVFLLIFASSNIFSAPISLNFSDIKVRDLLQLLAKFTEQNIVISDGVQGKISIQLNNVSWEQILNTLLTMRNLTKKQENNIILIAPNNELNVPQFANEPIKAEFIPIHYAQAETIATMLKNNILLNKQERMTVDTRTNTLWIEAPTSELVTVHQLVQQLDVPAKQVSIHARIVNADESFIRELGIKFNTSTSNTANNNNSNDLHMDMPVSNNKSGNFTFAVARLGGDNLLNLQLAALENEGKGKVISDPELITADRQLASIQSGEEIPYQEKTLGGATNIAFKKAVLSLKVTPMIMPNNKIMLQLVINQDKVSPLSVNGVPAIQTREVNTQVLVNNGETIVLGGIYEHLDNQEYERVPFLGSMPIVGRFFRHEETKRTRRELLIFVTPKVL